MEDINTQESEIEETSESQNGKTEKKFTAVLKRLVAIVGGDKNLKIPRKTPKDQVGTLVNELFKEEREVIEKETKESLKTLLKQYAELEKAADIKRKELEKLVKTKKEEFSKAAEALFNRIEDVGEIEKLYYAALNSTQQ